MICVDKLRDCPPTRGWPYTASAHLYSDDGDLEELHDFAERLGLRRQRFQPTTLPHYDLTPKKHQAAIDAGAAERSKRQMVETIRWYRSREGMINEIYVR